MRAAVLTAIRTLEIREVALPEPSEGEVLVRIRRVGICGSDLTAYRGRHPFRTPPVILGHEAAGEIISRPSPSSGLHEGDRVAILPIISCGVCRACRAGSPHLCEVKRVPGSGWPGLMSEYSAVPERVLTRLPNRIDVDRGAMIEPVAVACRSTTLGGVGEGSTVAVLGAGPIGGLAAWVSLIKKAGLVLASDLKPGNLAIMRRIGVQHVIDAGAESVLEAGLAATDGRGFDTVIVASGHAGAIAEAIGLVASQGVIVVLPMFDGLVTADLTAVVLREIRVAGSTTYTPGDFAAAFDLVSSEELDPRLLISRTVPLDGAAEALAELDAGSDLAKVQVEIGAREGDPK